MTPEEVMAEHEALKAQVAALQREHNALSSDGRNPDHVEHRIKLEHKIAELEEHMERLRALRKS